jgi:hypothetical protein
MGYWEGAAGVLIGSCIPLGWSWWRRRIERRGEIEAMIAEHHLAHISLKALITAGIGAPLYRLPISLTALTLPKLIGDRILDVLDVSALVEYVNRVEEINRGLERAGDAHAANDDAAIQEEHGRNVLKAKELLEQPLARHGDRILFDAVTTILLSLRSGDREMARVARCLHYVSLLLEVGGSLFIFLEARRMIAQLQAASHVDYAGGPPIGYQTWYYDAGSLGFALLAAGIVLGGIALAIESRRDR